MQSPQGRRKSGIIYWGTRQKIGGVRTSWGFPGGTVVKNSLANTGDKGDVV